MKRSRACEDLVALAQEAGTDNRTSDTWTRCIDGNNHRFKRSRASPVSSGDEADDQELQERHSLQFTLEMNDFSNEVLLSSSLDKTCVMDDDSLPLRRNSRENMLLRKKKQRVAEITNSFNDFGIQDKDVTMGLERPLVTLAKPQQVVMLPSPETPEPRLLRGLCFPRDSRCIDPLDKRQAQAFDMSAFIMLSISPKR